MFRIINIRNPSKFFEIENFQKACSIKDKLEEETLIHYDIYQKCNDIYIYISEPEQMFFN